MENNSYGLYSRGVTGWTSIRNEEFQEEDVWAVLNKIKKDTDPTVTISSSKETALVSKRLPTATRMIPKSTKAAKTIIQQTSSAPINVPDWSKIYGTNTKATPKNSSSWLHPESDGDRFGCSGNWESEDEEEGGGGYDQVVPPHELIARTRGSSFSVCEGAGRTLKGRDLSRVRNAVLTKTGFLESKSNHY